MFSLPSAQRSPFLGENFVTCFQLERERSESLSYTCCFSSDFSSKQSCQSSLFWCGILLNLHKWTKTFSYSVNGSDLPKSSSLAEYISKFSSFYHTTYPKTDIYFSLFLARTSQELWVILSHSKRKKSVIYSNYNLKIHR